jgi:hypothetical protein
MNAENADAFAAGFLSETETEFNAKLEQLKHLLLVSTVLSTEGPMAQKSQVCSV